MFHSSLLSHVATTLLSLLQPLILVHHGMNHTNGRYKRSAKSGGTDLTVDDVDVVMSALGISGWIGDAKCKEHCLLEEVHVLLVEKKASLRELEEALRVFDFDGDGFICPMELQNVMIRLGLEDTRYEDCEKMIHVFDKDGDGRISMEEFGAMMQGAV